MTQLEEDEDLDTVERHREFMLAALRVASGRCRLMANEVDAIGVSLQHRMIGPEFAVRWMHDLQLGWLIEPLPGKIGAIAKAEGEQP